MEIALMAFLGDAVATLFFTISLAVQKMGHREVEKQDGEYAFLTNKTWILGFSLLWVSIAFRLLCLPYADMTLLSANCSIAIVSNFLLSAWLFEEKITFKYDLTAFALILTGTCCIVYLSNKDQEKLEGERLLECLSRPGSFVFFIGVIILIQLTHFVLSKFEDGLRQFENDADLADYRTRYEIGANATELIFPPDDNQDEETEQSRGLLDKQRPLRVLIEKMNSLE